jgi:hypothetical protein
LTEPENAEDGRRVLEAFLAEMRAEFPRFVVIEKAKSPLSRAIDLALKVLTLGGQRSYLTHYYTVLGDRLYVPASFSEVDPIDAVVTLRHERIHLRQRRRYTLVGMAAIYLLFPVPLGLAWGRARIEWEAYTETLRATLELRGEAAVRSPRLRERIVSQFTSPAYGWMWPFERAVGRWYDEALEKMLAEREAEREARPQ